MSSITKVVSGVGVLIALYLFLSNATETSDIINTIGKNSINGIAVLQGRTAQVK